MAKFKYRMQSILNIKEKLEDQAKNDFSRARLHLDEETDKLQTLEKRKEDYVEEGRRIRKDAINIKDLENNDYAIEKMDEYILRQQEQVKRAECELENARIKLTEAMQETKIQNKLKEKAFEDFKKELNAAESKEVDELTSYTYGQKKGE